MLHGLRLSLGIRVSSGSHTWGPYVDADVQVWKGDDHIVTIDVLNKVELDVDYTHTEHVERYATYMARTAARIIEDAVYDLIESDKGLTSIKEIAEGLSSVSD